MPDERYCVQCGLALNALSRCPHGCNGDPEKIEPRPNLRLVTDADRDFTEYTEPLEDDPSHER